MNATIHPFPARMAPELALNTLKDLPLGSLVLDPMAGSGMVLRQANELGLNAIGFDMDPLAVLMTKVWTTPVQDELIEKTYKEALCIALSANPSHIDLPWIDDDKETIEFINYWFGARQKNDLRCWAYALQTLASQEPSEEELSALNVVRVALSRIIITKEQCASLARDTSHSRPHRVTTSSDYSVFLGLEQSINTIRKRLKDSPPKGGSNIQPGDARNILLPNESVDGVLTSPPYLNAIDYMRGHRMSLVWLGYRVGELRSVRSNSIGAERAPDTQAQHSEIIDSFGSIKELPNRYIAMINRYAGDIFLMTNEIARVLKSGGLATFVVGNSCLKGVFIKNSAAVATAAELSGLRVISTFERELPSNSRYLPIGAGSALNNRMRTETIFTATH